MNKANLKTIDAEYATACFYVEKELGVELTPDYPASKFVIQMEELGEHMKKEAQAAKGKGSSGIGGTLG